MKPAARWALGVILVILPGLALADSVRPLSVEDVLRLHFAGVSEEIIISEIIVTETVFELSVDEILRLKEAGISDRLLQFMVDTAIETEDVSETSWELEEVESEGEGEVWVNEIEETAPTTNYFVSLNYSYPSWWYDCYWWDYWYWDFDYYPYRTSFIWHFGSWYPGWYSYRWCWSPPYWGYRWHWYDRYGYWAWYHHGYSYPSYYYGYAYHHPGWQDRYRYPSDVKTKRGSYSPTKPLYADAGLKVRDGTRLPVRELRLRDDSRPGKTRDGRLLLTDGKPARPDGKDRVRLPSKPGVTPGLDRGAKTPDGTGRVDDRPTVRRPVRSVRAPAGGERPVKVKKIRTPTRPAEQPDRTVKPPTRPSPKPKSAPNPQAPDVRKPPSRSEKPAPTRKAEDRSRAVKQSPKPAPSPAPRVQSPPRSAPPKSPPAPRSSRSKTRGGR